MPTITEIVDWIDPDWRDHFVSVDDAAEYYQKEAHAEWAQAEAELAATDSGPDASASVESAEE